MRDEHYARMEARFAGALRVVEGGRAAAKLDVDPSADPYVELAKRYGVSGTGEPSVKPNSQPASSVADAKLNEAAARWVSSRRDNQN